MLPNNTLLLLLPRFVNLAGCNASYFGDVMCDDGEWLFHNLPFSFSATLRRFLVFLWYSILVSLNSASSRSVLAYRQTQKHQSPFTTAFFHAGDVYQYLTKYLEVISTGTRKPYVLTYNHVNQESRPTAPTTSTKGMIFDPSKPPLKTVYGPYPHCQDDHSNSLP